MTAVKMPPISLHVTLQKVSGDKNGRSNNKFKLLRSVSLDEFVLPKIQQRVRKRVNSERKPYSVHPFPKLGSGHGIYVFENKYFRYEGQWEKGEKHGFGKLLLQDGTYYEGQFTHGEITGHGFKYFSSSKCKYKGQFWRGEMHGKGMMEFPDGAVYEGTFVHNRKNGYGVMRTKEPFQMYEGSYKGNLRHGAGNMVYANGDRYEGYWVADKRHGRGVLHCADGSLYDGEFVLDEFHGQGLFRHVSGVVYDGLWINGFPAKMASKLHIIVEKTPLVIRQGTPFKIRVECRNEDDEIVGDDGRELQITAGFKFYQPRKGSALFDMIEDVEDKPIDTPFGYQVVHYPLTNQADQEEPSEEEDKEDELSLSQTQLDALKVSDEEDETQVNKEEENKEGEDVEKLEENDKLEEEKGPEEGVDSGGGSGGGDEEPEDNSAPSNTVEKESVPLPPPVPNQKTEEGVTIWEDIYLAPAPPMYRPFVAMEEAENDLKKNPAAARARSKAEDRRQSVASVVEEVMMKNSITKDEQQDSKTNVDKLRRQKEKALEEKYAKTGEYVLMIHDVTNPPFLERTLEPAFLLLKLKRPQAKKKQVKEAKKWDTSQHIKSQMRVMDNMAEPATDDQ